MYSVRIEQKKVRLRKMTYKIIFLCICLVKYNIKLMPTERFNIVTTYSSFPLVSSSSSLETDIIRGLTSTPKSLPYYLLYDERGSDLFEEITNLPEYLFLWYIFGARTHDFRIYLHDDIFLTIMYILLDPRRKRYNWYKYTRDNISR